MQPIELKAWVSARRLAEKRDLQEKKRSAIESGYQGSLAAIRFAGEVLGWPIPESPIRRRQDHEAREAWARLRKYYGSL